MQSNSTAARSIRRRLAAGVGLAALALGAAALPGLAGENSGVVEEESAARIEGAWGMTVTLRDCDTGAPLGPPFRSLVSFLAGGTILETPAALAFAPGQRSPGHGTWKTLQKRVFSQRTIALILFDTPPQPPSPGFSAGWQVIDHTVTLANRNHLTSEGTNQFFDSQGNLYRSGCSTAVGERFQ